jgi:uncharacterized membrane protein
MTLLDSSQSETDLMSRWSNGRSGPREAASPESQRSQESSVNVGSAERSVSIAAGAILALLGIARRGVPGLLSGGVGAAMLYRGVSGHCHMYGALGLDTARPERSGRSAQADIAERGIHVEQAFLINRSSEDLYGYWRNFENLPSIMTHLQSVQVLDERRSHWVATAPRIAGGKVEWDAEITQDEPNARIAWRSLPGSAVDCIGEIRFSQALGDRGTEVHVTMGYVPPAGRLGHWVAKLFGEAPRRQMHDDLRSFKRLMETGEIPTVVGQPRGTCTGRGKRET